MSEPNSKFDLSFLNKISGGDQNFIIEMITTFKEMTPEFISNSRKYIENKDYLALSREAHKYIPGVSFFGMKDLEKDLTFLEEYSKKETNLEQIPVLIERSINQIEEVIVILNKEFNLK
jgi:HPt (histidine-containing phosphotransfer) domain-containing protein